MNTSELPLLDRRGGAKRRGGCSGEISWKAARQVSDRCPLPDVA